VQIVSAAPETGELKRGNGTAAIVGEMRRYGWIRYQVRIGSHVEGAVVVTTAECNRKETVNSAVYIKGMGTVAQKAEQRCGKLRYLQYTASGVSVARAARARRDGAARGARPGGCRRRAACARAPRLTKAAAATATTAAAGKSTRGRSCRSSEARAQARRERR